MSEESTTNQRNVGIGSLPKVWGVAVQLVGTFGLAVFLVLWYIFVLQPQEVAKYEAINESVQDLMQVVEKQYSFITRGQEDNLFQLYVVAVSNELANKIELAIKDDKTDQELEKDLEDTMMLRTALLHGLFRKDGGVVSEMLGHKIRRSQIARELATTGLSKWRETPSDEIVKSCREALLFAIREQAIAK